MKRRGARRPPALPPDPDNADAAYEAAVKRLAAQPQSRAMLGDKLRRRGYRALAVETALDRAQAAGYLDDDAFARGLVRRRSASRGRSMIARELRSRGIDAEEIGRALDDLDPAVELERARVLAQALVRQRPPADRQALRASVGGRLGRRGFSVGIITRVLRELSEGPAQGQVDDAIRFDTLSEPD